MSKVSAADAFHDDLVRHRLIIPVGVPGIFGRSAVFEDVLQRIDVLLTQAASPDVAETFAFPPVISRKILEKVRYFDAFPHLCGTVHSFFGNESQAKDLSARLRDGTSWNGMLGMTDVALNPAACYPLYPTLTGTLQESGRRVTMLNWVFRHEPSPEPTRMQSFRVREFVALGSSGEVENWRARWVGRSLFLLKSLGLATSSDFATDPFFGAEQETLAATQKAKGLKIEISAPVIPGASDTALCSFNLHQAFFGLTFDIRTHDGQLANTACVGFGLERIVMALFAAHGFDPAQWPPAVRTKLWPSELQT